MSVTIRLNYPAPIPAGHVVEVTEFADERSAKGRAKDKEIDPRDASRIPVIQDLESGIRYMSNRHVSRRTFCPDEYEHPLELRPDLEVASIWRGTVRGTTVIHVEVHDGPYTILVVEPAA